MTVQTAIVLCTALIWLAAVAAAAAYIQGPPFDD
jgi:hypothetical protein